MNKKRVVVLTGAGISAESGINTFRGTDGIYSKYKIDEVTTVQALNKNPKKVFEFFNEMKTLFNNVAPNKAHYDLASLEEFFDVNIITQNVDDLHEKAGSTNVLHVHGELKKMRSSIDPTLIYDYNRDITVGDLCEKGSQLRPHVVLFGEDVPLYDKAVELVLKADYFLIVGTSLVVSPISQLVDLVDDNLPIFYVNIDIEFGQLSLIKKNVTLIEGKATEGVEKVIDLLKKFI